MARGTIAKQNVVNKLAIAFGKDYIGEVDKKIYVWADDGGERVQIAMSLVCPKANVEAPSVSSLDDTSGGWDFSEPVVKAQPAQRAEITDEEKQKLANMMERLGL